MKVKTNVDRLILGESYEKDKSYNVSDGLATMLLKNGFEKIRETPTYRYIISSTDYSSKKYGGCEICGKYCDNVYYQIEQKEYTQPDGTPTWTQHGCKNLFGHEKCLISVRILEGLN